MMPLTIWKSWEWCSNVTRALMSPNLCCHSVKRAWWWFSCLKRFLLMKKINNTIFKKEITEQCYAIIMTDPKPFVSSAGEKPFSCLHCSRAFADRSNLRAHLQTHSEMKKYQCACCLKTFSRISLLAKHQEAGCPLSWQPVEVNIIKTALCRIFGTVPKDPFLELKSQNFMPKRANLF